MPRQLAVAVAMAAAICAGGPIFAQQSGRTPALGDVSSAKQVAVRDSAGATVLEGNFDHRQERDGDIDKDARLTGGGGAYGEADIDIERSGSVELEIEVRGLAANETFGVWIDGRQVGTLQTNARGRAEVEWRNR